MFVLIMGINVNTTRMWETWCAIYPDPIRDPFS